MVFPFAVLLEYILGEQHFVRQSTFQKAYFSQPYYSPAGMSLWKINCVTESASVNCSQMDHEKRITVITVSMLLLKGPTRWGAEFLELRVIFLSPFPCFPFLFMMVFQKICLERHPAAILTVYCISPRAELAQVINLGWWWMASCVGQGDV